MFYESASHHNGGMPLHVAGNTLTGVDPEVTNSKGTGPAGPRIRCPLCTWSPDESARWTCKCLHCWNTFDTGGICPACLHQWTSTQCLACGGWSPHSDWYEY